MKNNFITFLVILSVGFVFTSCSKYKAGPKITILTKKHRITGDWLKEKGYGSYNYELENAGIQKMEIYKDGLITYLEDSVEVTGKWEFIKDKESISITNDYLKPTSYQEFSIRQLKNKEIILEDEVGTRHTFVKS